MTATIEAVPHRRDECPACGTWECAECGHVRSYANRFSGEPQICVNQYCRSAEGQMLPVRHYSRWRRTDHETEYARMISLGEVPRYPLPQSPQRPGWDDYFLGIAEAVAARGECVRSKVGAVVVRNRRIVATGYNGVAAGVLSCLDGMCPRAANGVPRGALYDGNGPGHCIALHAEENAINDLERRDVREGRDRPGTGGNGPAMVRADTLYVNKEPCERCEAWLHTLGLRVVWRDLTKGTRGELLG